MLKGWNLLIQTYTDILNGMPAASVKNIWDKNDKGKIK